MTDDKIDKLEETLADAGFAHKGGGEFELTEPKPKKQRKPRAKKERPPKPPKPPKEPKPPKPDKALELVAYLAARDVGWADAKDIKKATGITRAEIGKAVERGLVATITVVGIEGFKVTPAGKAALPQPVERKALTTDTKRVSEFRSWLARWHAGNRFNAQTEIAGGVANMRRLWREMDEAERQILADVEVPPEVYL